MEKDELTGTAIAAGTDPAQLDCETKPGVNRILRSSDKFR